MAGADAPALAQALAERLGTDATVHERFGTAFVEHGDARLDFATRRAESYPAPGALPEVRAGTPREDLLRRDFTVNAIAVALDGAQPGVLRAVPNALADLRAGRLRVLHDESFLDDPTRLLRLARYRVRLDFAVEPHTAELAHAALSGRALDTVSGARIGAELRLALAEAQAPAVLKTMGEMGLLSAVHPRLRHDAALVERALGLLPADGERRALLLAALVLPLLVRIGGEPQGETSAPLDRLGLPEGEQQAEARALLDRLEFPQNERERALAAGAAIPRLLDELPRRMRPSELWQLASGVPLEGVALAGALDADDESRSAAVRWLTEVRYVRLEITGADLLAAGVPQGPEVGRRLAAALRARLDGELDEGSEAELAAALELP